MKWRLLRGNTFTYEKISPQEPPLHARSSSIPGIRILSIMQISAFEWENILIFTKRISRFEDALLVKF